MRSIVVVTYNELGDTLRCVDSVYNCTGDFELIFVDNGSTDGTRGYLQELAKIHPNVKVILNDSNAGFGPACNQGIAIATGEYVVLLNNDCIVTPNWLDRLINGMEVAATKALKFDRFYAIGPMSNVASGHQVQTGISYNDDEINNVAKALWERKGEKEFIRTGFLSGFCMVIRKELLDAIGAFDERFVPGGFEDNDFCLRALLAGYPMVVHGGVFVHHTGHKTIRHMPELRSGLANRYRYYQKWQIPADKRVKLVGTIRVKNGERYIKRTLDNLSLYCDEIVVFNDHSTDQTVPLCRACPKVVEITDSQETTFDERRDRQTLYEMAVARGAEWILTLDSDEELEAKVDDEYMQRLLHPANPEICGYGFYWSTFWNDEQHIRVDQPWGHHIGVRLTRVLPGAKIVGGDDKGLHCGNMPVPPVFNTRQTAIRVKHYGYVDPKVREEKYAYYTKLDPNPDPVLAGPGNYRHIVDETNSIFAPWCESNGVSLNMMVRDEAELIMEVLDNVRELVDEIVVVDTGSVDDTKTRALLYGAKVFDFPWKDDFAAPRNFGLDKCTQKWILHMDADERLPIESQVTIRPMLERMSDYGFHGPVWNLHLDGSRTVSEAIRLFRNDPRLRYTGYVHETLDDAFDATKLPFTRVNWVIYHMGYLKGHTKVQRKLDLYEKLNLRMLKEKPKDPRPYFNLAMHYINDGQVGKGVSYLEKAAGLNPKMYHPRKELGFLYLERALEYFEETLKLLPPNHDIAKYLREAMQAIGPYAQKHVKVGNSALAAGALDVSKV